MAVTYENDDLIKEMIKWGYNPNIGDQTKYGTIVHSVLRGEGLINTEVLDLICACGFNPRSTDEDGNSP